MNVAWFFLSHRLAVAREALARGFSVHLAADCAEPDEILQVERAGIRFHRLHVERGGVNPLRDLELGRQLRGLYQDLRPDIVHHVSIKPVLYGGIVAREAGVPVVVHAISGVGYLFTRRDLKARLLQAMVGIGYRWSMGNPRARVIFQNETDRAQFVDAGWVDRARTVLIRGSGVDLDAFRAAPEPPGPTRFVLPARILVEKGVTEFLEAASRLRASGSSARFLMAGGLDSENPGSFTREAIERLSASAGAEWLGHVGDMSGLLRSCHVVCLPSYREGTPKALLEACASARAIVTTDVPGCRDVVRHGENGLLVPPRDPLALADAMQRLDADPAMRRRMGEAGRLRAELEFDERVVVERTIELYGPTGQFRPP